MCVCVEDIPAISIVLAYAVKHVPLSPAIAIDL